MKVTKKFFKIAVPVCGAVLCTIFVLTFMLTSYFGWQGGYNKYLADLQWKKDHAGTVMTDMTIGLKDGVEFFNNGKARPSKSDFVVTASYIVDGVREYSEPLIDEDYTLTVPADFAEKGGTVKAKYDYFAEGGESAPEGETPAPTQTFEATVDVALTKVVPVRLEMVTKPYLVAYEAGAMFSLKGASFNAVLNDGTVLPVDNSVLAPPTKPLTVGDKYAKVAYTSEGTTVAAEIPIKVMAKGEFTNGTLLSLEVMSATAEHGKPLSAAALDLYGVYSSGNYVSVPADDYVVVNGEEIAALGDVQVIKVASRADLTVYCSAALRVQANAAAGEPTDRVYSFALDSTYVNRASFSVLCENTTDAAVRLSDVLTVTVNGRAKSVPVSVNVAAGGSGAVQVNDVLLSKGRNDIDVAFASDAAMAKLKLTGIRLENGYDGFVTDYFGEYVQKYTDAGEPVELEVKPVVSFDDGLWNYGYGYGMCSDGEWIFVGMCDPNSGRLRITKLDPKTNELVAVTAISQQAGKLEDYTGIFFYDGKVVACTPSGKFFAVDADFTGKGQAELQEYTALSFAGITKPTNVCYNSVERTFAVTTEDFKLHFFDAECNKLSEFDIPKNDSEGGVFLRMTGNAKYLYFSYKKNGRPEPLVTIRNWAGDVLNKELTISVSRKDMGFGPDDGTPGVSLARNSNSHALMELNGDVYFLIVCWGNGRDGYGLFKAPFIKGEYSVPSMNLGEFTGVCEDNGIDATLEAERLKRYPFGQVFGGGDMFGICTDGKYGYWAYSKINGENMKNTIIFKFDLKTGEKLGTTLSQEMDRTEDGWHNHSQMFFKDGYIYVVDYYGKFYRVWAEDITADKSPALEPADDVTFAGLDGKVLGAYYNTVNDRFLVYTDADEIAYYDGKLRFIKKTACAAPEFTSPDDYENETRFRAGVAGNADYVYVLQNEMGALKATIHLFDWEGNYLGVTSVGNISPGTEDADCTRSRVTGMTELNGRLYFTVSDRAGTWITLCTAEPDLSVFAA